MNDRFSQAQDRLVHKTDENDDRQVRRFGEDDLNTPRHTESAGDTTSDLQESHRDDASLDRPDADRRDTLTDDRDDAFNDAAAIEDNDRDGALAHSPAVTPGTPVTGTHQVPATGSTVTPGFPETTSDRPDDVLDEDTGFTDTDQTEQVGQAPAAHTDAASLFSQDSDDVRRRWQEVQAGFVDDPRDAVERADSLLDEITTSFRSALEARSSDLQGRWKNTDKNDTEDLRTALRDYRATLEQLLNISSGTR